jgi:predicted SnoaL-like aldol condensation-catalyzing enzyme
MQPHIGGAADATAWREELERILASASFAGASRMRALLAYLVRETMAGRGERLKEYTVGQEVFGRTKDFDPRIDTLVRTEAWRLRARLAQYYVGEGAGNPLRIELPDEAVPRNMFSFDLHGRMGLVPGVFLEGAGAVPEKPQRRPGPVHHAADARRLDVQRGAGSRPGPDQRPLAPGGAQVPLSQEEKVIHMQPTQAQAPADEARRNKQLVIDFYRHVFDARNPAAVKDYVAEDYHQHCRHMPQGRARLEGFVAAIAGGQPPLPVQPELANPPAILVAEGDMVVIGGPCLNPTRTARASSTTTSSSTPSRSGAASSWSTGAASTRSRHPSIPAHPPGRRISGDTTLEWANEIMAFGRLAAARCGGTAPASSSCRRPVT